MRLVYHYRPGEICHGNAIISAFREQYPQAFDRDAPDAAPPDAMYVLMVEQMRSMNEEAKSLQVTNEGVQRIVEHVVRLRLMMANMKKQGSDDDSQRVEKMEHGLKVLMVDVRARQKEVEARETKEQNVTISLEEEVGRTATREGRGCAGVVQGGMRCTR